MTFVPRITVWHRKACQVMTNSDLEGQIFLSHPHMNNGFFFLPTIKYRKKIDNYVMIVSLKSEPTCKLINSISGSPLLISSLPGTASGTHVESLGKPYNSTSVLEALPDTLDIKRHSPSILYLLYPPPKLCLWWGILFSRCPSVRNILFF